MTSTLPAVADQYIQTINRQDAASFLELFAKDAVVDDNGRLLNGVTEIGQWSKSDIFDALVSLEVLEVNQGNGETVITTIVDGNFDRTGLPDPVVISHTIKVDGGKIGRLTCRLAGEAVGN